MLYKVLSATFFVTTVFAAYMWLKTIRHGTKVIAYWRAMAVNKSREKNRLARLQNKGKCPVCDTRKTCEHGASL